MSISLPPEFERFVAQEIACGTFESEEDVFDEALRLLREQKLRQERFREQLGTRLERLDRGEGIHVESEGLKAFFGGIVAEVDAELAEGEKNAQ